MDSKTLSEMAKTVENLRCSFLLNTEERKTGKVRWLSPLAQEHLLLAMAALESARSHFKLAAISLERRE